VFLGSKRKDFTFAFGIDKVEQTTPSRIEGVHGVRTAKNGLKTILSATWPLPAPRGGFFPPERNFRFAGADDQASTGKVCGGRQIIGSRVHCPGEVLYEKGSFVRPLFDRRAGAKTKSEQSKNGKSATDLLGVIDRLKALPRLPAGRRCLSRAIRIVCDWSPRINRCFVVGGDRGVAAEAAKRLGGLGGENSPGYGILGGNSLA